MLGIAFGDATSDVTAFLKSLPVVGDKLASGLPTISSYVREQAKAGAEAAIPDIKTQVKDQARNEVKPYIIGALALGAIGTFFSIAALVKLKHRS